MPNLVILIGDKQIIEIVFTTAIWSFCHFVPVLLDIPSSDDTCENKFAYTHWTSNSYLIHVSLSRNKRYKRLSKLFFVLKDLQFLYTAVFFLISKRLIWYTSWFSTHFTRLFWFILFITLISLSTFVRFFSFKIKKKTQRPSEAIYKLRKVLTCINR